MRPKPIGWAFWSAEEPPAPKIFNATQEARGGDVISIQGANLDASTTVFIERSAGQPENLSIVNRVGETQIAVQLPPVLVDPVLIRLKNASGTSDILRLNAARPLHLDATRLTPGGRFRLFGRNLRVAGHQPSLQIDGQPASIDPAASTDGMLVATVPLATRPTDHAEIVSDNGNGSGATSLAIRVPVEAAAAGDPLNLGVGWAAAFTFTAHVVNAPAACDGTTDDAPRIAAAIAQAAKDGGGVVLLPAGTCRIASTIDLASKVILRGAGQDRTILRYEGNYPVFAEHLDLVGLQDFTLVNAGTVQEGLVWRSNTRSVIQRVTMDMAKSRQWFLTHNRDFVFDHNAFKQIDSYNQQNPYRFDESSGLVFSNNASVNVAGSPTFQFIHDAVFIDNHFTRDASAQNESPVTAHHQFVVDFSYRVSIVGNRFDVVNGPVTNTLRNDGETILVEGGGPLRTEQIGTVSRATADTLTDTATLINTDPFKSGLPENFGIAIVSGRGTGQARRVIASQGSTLKIDRPWDVVPDSDSHYATFVWGLEDAIIQGNTLADNPRGIWLYQTSIRNVAIVDNIISDGGGIYLRAFQKVGDHLFNVQLNTLISGNVITNGTGRWMSYINISNVRSDQEAFGTGEIGIEVRGNRIVANTPNVSSTVEEYASREGYSALVHTEHEAGGRLSGTPPMLGTIVQNNMCERCDKPFVVGTGSYGAVFADNQPALQGSGVLSDLTMMGNRFGGSSGTLAR